MRSLVSIVVIMVCVAGCGGSAPEARSPEASRQRMGGAARDSEERVPDGMFVMGAKKSDGPPPAPGQPQPSTTPASAPAMDPARQASTDAPPATRDLVIYTAHYVMAVYQVDQGIAAVERIAKEQNGYLAVKKDREITIRIPRARFESALAGVDKIGDVLHRDVEALDVTDEHVDLEIRIKNARAVQRQLTELLSKANVKEALDIEKELSRVTEELERMEGKLKLLNDKVAFSTITVSFEPRGNTLATQRVRLPFPWLSGLNLPTLLQLNEDK